MANDFPHQEKITKLIKDDFADNFVESLADSRKMHKAIIEIVDEGITKKIIFGAFILLITFGSLAVSIGKIYIEKTIEINLSKQSNILKK